MAVEIISELTGRRALLGALWLIAATTFIAPSAGASPANNTPGVNAVGPTVVAPASDKDKI